MTIVKQKPVFISNILDEIFNPSFTENQFSLSQVATNIHETNDAYLLEVNAPGCAKEDFKINAEHGLLTISYENKKDIETKDAKTIRREFSVKTFKRSFSLNENVNIDAIVAKYDAGILTVTLPKKDEVKVQSKAISVN